MCIRDRSYRTYTTDSSLTFTTTMRVIVRVHYGTSYCRSDTHVSFSTCFTDLDVLVVEVADFTDRCSASDVDFSNFSGRQSYLSESAFLSHQLSAVTSGSNPVSYTHLDVYKRQVRSSADLASGICTCGKLRFSLLFYFERCFSHRLPPSISQTADRDLRAELLLLRLS